MIFGKSIEDLNQKNEGKILHPLFLMCIAFQQLNVCACRYLEYNVLPAKMIIPFPTLLGLINI